MAFFKKTPPLEDDLDADYIAPEILAGRRRKKLWILFFSLLAVALVAAVVAARPLGRAIKGWQAERAAAKVDVFLAEKDFKAAQGKVQDALALSPSNAVAMRAAARFLARKGAHAESVAFWKKVEPRLALKAEDERLYAGALLGMGDAAGAETYLQRAWPKRPDGGVPEDWALGFSLALQRRDEAAAVDLARRLLESPATDPEVRLRVAVLLVSSGNGELRAMAQQAIETMSRQKEAVGLEALLTLGRQSASKNPEKEISSDQVAGEIEAHPLAQVRHRLFAIDLRLLGAPQRKEELVADAVSRFQKSDEDLEALTAWLYGKGEYQKILELLPEETALHRQTLFLQRLDTLAALGRWQEVRTAIQESRFSLDRITMELYLARCDEQLGNPVAAKLHWQAALDTAAGDVRQLGMVGSYALKSGEKDIARAAGHALIEADPTVRGSYEMLLQLAQEKGDTAELNRVLQKMAGQWPGDEAVSNDLAYTNLLLGQEMEGASQIASRLFEKTPRSLPHRITLALAKYRAEDFTAGLAPLENILGDTAPLTSRLLALRSALLWALDRKEEARAALQTVDAPSLLPEEKKWIEPVLQER